MNVPLAHPNCLVHQHALGVQMSMLAQVNYYLISHFDFMISQGRILFAALVGKVQQQHAQQQIVPCVIQMKNVNIKMMPVKYVQV